MLKVKNPYSSFPSTTFKYNIELIIKCDTLNSKIYYTLDNTDPDLSSILYDGLIINITNDTTIKIIAILDGYLNSDIILYNYKKLISNKQKIINHNLSIIDSTYIDITRNVNYNKENFLILKKNSLLQYHILLKFLNPITDLLLNYLKCFLKLYNCNTNTNFFNFKIHPLTKLIDFNLINNISLVLYSDVIYKNVTLRITKDISVDITLIYNYWLSNNNYGLIIIMLSLNELYLKLYSHRTNTIHYPVLNISINRIENYKPNTLELNEIFINKIFNDNIDNMYIYLKDVKNLYHHKDVIKMNLSIYPKYVKKSFKDDNTTNRIYNNIFFGIRDYLNKLLVLTFSENTKLNYDNENNYFYLNCNMLHIGRFYTILFKIVDDKQTKIIDTGQIFQLCN